MKVAYITPRFHPFKGGAEQNIFALASRVAKLGHSVTILTTNVKFNKESLPKEEFYKGMEIVRNWAPTEALYAGFYPGLLIELFKDKYDVIHSAGIGFFWREFCLILRKVFSKKKTKFIVTPNGPFMALNDKGGLRGLVRSVGTAFLKIYINWLYDVFVAVNPKQNEWMINLYHINPSKIKLVPNGIDESYIEKNIVEHKPEDKVVITYINRMEEYKGIQQVLKALDRLLNTQSWQPNRPKSLVMKLPEFAFYIMGRPGGFTTTLERMVKELNLREYVKFVLSPSDEERDKVFYNESQINILPSKWEATGIALLEAMAKGNVIVTTHQNEVADIIIHTGENGYVYDYPDIDKLTEILKELITNYDLRTKMRKKNIEMASQFTWESILPKYLEILK